MTPILEIQKLSHIYSPDTPFEHAALSNVDLTISRGEFVGLIGHTGSGKSTLVQHMNGLLKPTSGHVLFDGRDIWEDPKFTRQIRFRVGLVFQYPEYQLFEETVYADIAFGPKNMGLSKDEIDARVRRAAGFVGISEAELAKSPFDLSGGQKRRAAIAGVIAMEPDVLILDEPTVGLDPKQIIEIRDLIKSLGKKHTVILSSHILSEVSAVCDYVMIIAKGQLVASDTPENLSKLMLGSNTVTCTVHGTRKQLVPALNALDAKEIQYENTPNEEQIKVKITTEKDKDIREELFYALAKANCPILELTSSSMSLEDVFLELTDDSGKAARKLKKAEKEQLKQKEREKECEPEADKTAVGETSEEKSTDAAESAAETKQEEGDAQ
mgnify:CR=1 FL=1